MLSIERNAFLFRDELCEFFLRENINTVICQIVHTMNSPT